MSQMALTDGLSLASILFILGLVGMVIRRNILFNLICIEIMLNAAALVFIVGDLRWAKTDGQIMFLFILAISAAEVAVGLALLLQFDFKFKTLDSDSASQMRG